MQGVPVPVFGQKMRKDLLHKKLVQELQLQQRLREGVWRKRGDLLTLAGPTFSDIHFL